MTRESAPTSSSHLVDHVQDTDDDTTGTTTGSKTILSILGAGQLAQMLVSAARKLGFATRTLAHSPEDPAAACADQVVYGDATDPKTLAAVFQDATWVAIESELIDPAVLALMDTTGLAARLRPRSDVIARFSDKLLQKKGLSQLSLPTLGWEELASLPQDLSPWTALLAQRFPQGYVLKWSRGGYDGHGVYRVGNAAAPDLPQLTRFVQEGFKRGGMVYAEELCAFIAEVAVVAVRSINGAFTAYPVVMTHQDRGICSEVLGPATICGIDAEALAQAQEVARRVGEGFDLVGTYAVEFFLRRGNTSRPEVVVNEIAPRVHNSGHYSQDAAVTSQFENHWRALLGLPLGSTDSAPFFGMVNILGPEGKSGPIDPPRPFDDDSMTLHWYGKSVSRPRRKLGHVNVRGDSLDQLNQRLALVRQHIKAWDQT